MAGAARRGYFRTPMSRRTSRAPRLPFSLRTQALCLLLAWCGGLLLPAFHVEPESAPESAAEAHPHGGHHAEHCSGRFASLPAHPSLGSDCPDPAGCENPWHHHHPVSRHDTAHCPACSSLLVRAVEIAITRPVAPAPAAHVTLPAPRVAAVSERHNAALARGPPAPPSALDHVTADA